MCPLKTSFRMTHLLSGHVLSIQSLSVNKQVPFFIRNPPLLRGGGCQHDDLSRY